MTVKQKGILKEMFKTESWDKIAFWADGSWAEVGSGYGGEQDGDNPIFMLSRSSFYDSTQAMRRAMIKALDEAVLQEGQVDFWADYVGFLGVE